VSVRKTGVLLTAMTMALAVAWGGNWLQGQEAQGEIARRAKNKVPAVYPDLARRMNLTGTVKVEVVIAPNGNVKNAKVIGGHPVLADAALDAVRKWRFEPTTMESSGVVEFKFAPRN